MILYFHIFEGCFEVLKSQYSKFLCVSPLSPMFITTCTTVVELLIYCKKVFLINQNKNYLSTVFTNP